MEVDIEKCNMWNFKRSVTLNMTLDEVKVTSHQYTQFIQATSMPDHLTIASSSTEMWPFEIHVISTFREAGDQGDNPGQATEGSTVSSIKCDRCWHLD